ncbi:MAG: tRNA (adenosine(37)-N6)-dimethylallyltransferase MiaA [Bdellovibrionaceae bacterium]|nr:tRNA (adenosine(37)-N6)-dimethylallyltransferase MiaA [Pseudobdellovibrionaceae bacterium]
MAELTSSEKRVIFVQGATATGKSQWAMTQAGRLTDACVVNCDSVQIYTHVNIGSNKPSAEERALVPHYLYDLIDFPETVTAGQYERLFFSLLESIAERNVFVVGGTGFYFQAIEKGMYPVRHISDQVKTEAGRLVLEKGFEYLFDWIQSHDPGYAKKISRNDSYRIERAYQLMRSENKSMTQIQYEFSKAQRPFPYALLKIGIREEKDILLDIVAKRTLKMLQAGLVEEVRGMLGRGMQDWDPLSSVGYKETVAFVRRIAAGEKVSESGLADEISQNTMKLIKKQKTWFQRDKQIHWLHRSDHAASVVDSFIGSKP